MLRNIGEQSRESVESVQKKKRKATVGRICYYIRQNYNLHGTCFSQLLAFNIFHNVLENGQCWKWKTTYFTMPFSFVSNTLSWSILWAYLWHLTWFVQAGCEWKSDQRTHNAAAVWAVRPAAARHLWLWRRKKRLRTTSNVPLVSSGRVWRDCRAQLLRQH